MSKNYPEILGDCESPASGCFATDEGAAALLYRFDDWGIRANFESAAVSAYEAGREGVAIEDASYRPLAFTDMTPGSGELVMNPTLDYVGAEPIIPTSEDLSDIDKARIRVARCAHACGQKALGCPIFKSEPEQPAKDPEDENFFGIDEETGALRIDHLL